MYRMHDGMKGGWTEGKELNEGKMNEEMKEGMT